MCLHAWQTQTKPVKMMHQTAEFPVAFIPEMNSQVLELRYVGRNLSMFIILPNEIQDEITGLQKVRQHRFCSQKWYFAAKPKKINLGFPKEPFRELFLKETKKGNLEWKGSMDVKGSSLNHQWKYPECMWFVVLLFVNCKYMFRVPSIHVGFIHTIFMSYPAWKGTDLREADGVDQIQHDASTRSWSISAQI